MEQIKNIKTAMGNFKNRMYFIHRTGPAWEEGEVQVRPRIRTRVRGGGAGSAQDRNPGVRNRGGQVRAQDLGPGGREGRVLRAPGISEASGAAFFLAMDVARGVYSRCLLPCDFYFYSPVFFLY